MKKYLVATLIIGSALSCSEPVEETNEDILSGEWVIEEIFVDLDIPLNLIEEGENPTPAEFLLPEDLVITQVLYSQQEGIDINGIDLTGEVNLASSYTIELLQEGLYKLENREEFESLNIMEFFFQYATPLFLQTYFPPAETYTDLGNGDFEYYFGEYDITLDYEYFAGSSFENTTQGIWETVGQGEQVLFDYASPLYEEGTNLWDFEVVDDNTIILTQFGESAPQLVVTYIEESETRIGGVDESNLLFFEYSNTAIINNASITLKRN